MTSTAECLTCDWATTGPDMGTVDRAADRHTRDTGHPTLITTLGGTR